MNYQSAKIFLSVVEHGSFSAAANALYLSQPAVSSYLSRLEEDLGAQLFVRQRGRNGITLTPEGKRFLPVAKNLLSVEKQLQDFRESCKQKTLRIAASDLAQEKLVSYLIEKLQHMLPAVTVQQYTIPPDVVDTTSNEQPFDVSLRIHHAFRPVSTNSFASIPCFRDPWCILCPSDTPLPDRVLSPADLDPAFQIRTILSHESLVDWQQQYFPDDTVRPSLVALRQRNIPAYFRDPRCWSIISATTAGHFLEQYPGMLTCRPVEPAPLSGIGYVAVSKSYSRPDIIRAFLRCCQEYVEERLYLENLIPEDIDTLY